MKKFLKRLSSTSREALHKDSDTCEIDRNNDLAAVGYEVKEKELSKLQKAVWQGDYSAVQRLVMKEAMVPDKESR